MPKYKSGLSMSRSSLEDVSFFDPQGSSHGTPRHSKSTAFLPDGRVQEFQDHASIGMFTNFSSSRLATDIESVSICTPQHGSVQRLRNCKYQKRKASNRH